MALKKIIRMILPSVQRFWTLIAPTDHSEKSALSASFTIAKHKKSRLRNIKLQ